MRLFNAEEDIILTKYHPYISVEIYKDKVFNHDITSVDLSIILPCYNAEMYIEQCLDSIFTQQTKYTYEVILINDGSSDKTLEILREYKKKYKNIVIIDQINKGHSGARNAGLKEASGNYLAFVDADDYLSDNYVEALMAKAYMEDADIVECGYITFKNNTIIKKVSILEEKSSDFVTGCPWGKVYKRELWEHLEFPEGYWYEDTIIAHLIYPKVQKHYSVSGCFYAYRSNPLGITLSSKGKMKTIDSFYITNIMIDNVDKYIAKEYSMSIAYNKLLILQFYINHKRVKGLNLECRKQIFNYQSSYYKKYYVYDKNVKRSLYEKTMHFGWFWAAEIVISLEKVKKIFFFLRK